MSNRKLTAAAVGLAALAVLIMPLMSAPARAERVRSTGCVGSFGAFSCVTSWRGGRKDPHVRAAIAPEDARDIAESKERDRRWRALCRPVLRQDAFGVPRYVYAAPGCEFGRYQ